MQKKFMFSIKPEKNLNPTRDKEHLKIVDLKPDEPKLSTKGLPNILVVDDDPLFGKIMKKVALETGVELTFCKSIDEFGGLGSFNYDVVVMDYDLGAVTGFELTSYLERYTKDPIPVVLVSQTQQESSREWPITIKDFVHKKSGPFAVLTAALGAHQDRDQRA